MRKPPEKPSDISQQDWDAVDVPEATAELEFVTPVYFGQILVDVVHPDQIIPRIDAGPVGHREAGLG